MSQKKRSASLTPEEKAMEKEFARRVEELRRAGKLPAEEELRKAAEAVRLGRYPIDLALQLGKINFESPGGLDGFL